MSDRTIRQIRQCEEREEQRQDEIRVRRLKERRDAHMAEIEQRRLAREKESRIKPLMGSSDDDYLYEPRRPIDAIDEPWMREPEDLMDRYNDPLPMDRRGSRGSQDWRQYEDIDEFERRPYEWDGNEFERRPYEWDGNEFERRPYERDGKDMGEFRMPKMSRDDEIRFLLSGGERRPPGMSDLEHQHSSDFNRQSSSRREQYMGRAIDQKPAFTPFSVGHIKPGDKSSKKNKNEKDKQHTQLRERESTDNWRNYPGDTRFDPTSLRSSRDEERLGRMGYERNERPRYFSDERESLKDSDQDMMYGRRDELSNRGKDTNLYGHTRDRKQQYEDMPESQREHQFPKDRRDNKNKMEDIPHPDTLEKCPMPACFIECNDLRFHAMQKHVPKIFETVEDSDKVSQANLSPMRVAALRALKLAILGPHGTLNGLMDLVNGIGVHITHEDELSCSHWAMVDVCRDQGWPEPDHFSLNPVNSPAVLIHWRAQLILMGLIDEKRREKILSAFPPSGASLSKVEIIKPDSKETRSPSSSESRKPDRIKGTDKNISSSRDIIIIDDREDLSQSKRSQNTDNARKPASRPSSGDKNVSEKRKNLYSSSGPSSRKREKYDENDDFSSKSTFQSRSNREEYDSLHSTNYRSDDNRRDTDGEGYNDRGRGNPTYHDSSSHSIDHSAFPVSASDVSSYNQPLSAGNFSIPADFFNTFRNSMGNPQMGFMQPPGFDFDMNMQNMQSMQGFDPNQFMAMWWAAANSRQQQP